MHSFEVDIGEIYRAKTGIMSDTSNSGPALSPLLPSLVGLFSFLNSMKVQLRIQQIQVKIKKLVGIQKHLLGSRRAYDLYFANLLVLNTAYLFTPSLLRNDFSHRYFGERSALGTLCLMFCYSADIKST